MTIIRKQSPIEIKLNPDNVIKQDQIPSFHKFYSKQNKTQEHHMFGKDNKPLSHSVERTDKTYTSGGATIVRESSLIATDKKSAAPLRQLSGGRDRVSTSVRVDNSWVPKITTHTHNHHPVTHHHEFHSSNLAAAEVHPTTHHVPATIVRDSISRRVHQSHIEHIDPAVREQFQKDHALGYLDSEVKLSIMDLKNNIFEQQFGFEREICALVNKLSHEVKTLSASKHTGDEVCRCEVNLIVQQEIGNLHKLLAQDMNGMEKYIDGLREQFKSGQEDVTKQVHGVKIDIEKIKNASGIDLTPLNAQIQELYQLISGESSYRASLEADIKKSMQLSLQNKQSLGSFTEMLDQLHKQILEKTDKSTLESIMVLQNEVDNFNVKLKYQEGKFGQLEESVQSYVQSVQKDLTNQVNLTKELQKKDVLVIQNQLSEFQDYINGRFRGIDESFNSQAFLIKNIQSAPLPNNDHALKAVEGLREQVNVKLTELNSLYSGYQKSHEKLSKYSQTMEQELRKRLAESQQQIELLSVKKHDEKLSELIVKIEADFKRKISDLQHQNSQLKVLIQESSQSEKLGSQIAQLDSLQKKKFGEFSALFMTLKTDLQNMVAEKINASLRNYDSDSNSRFAEFKSLMANLKVDILKQTNENLNLSLVQLERKVGESKGSIQSWRHEINIEISEALAAQAKALEQAFSQKQLELQSQIILINEEILNLQLQINGSHQISSSTEIELKQKIADQASALLLIKSQMEQISVLSQEFHLLKVNTSSSYSREVEDLRKQVIASNSLIAALEKRVNEQFLLKSSEIRAVAVSVTALSDEIKQLIQYEEDSIRAEIKRSFELNLADVSHQIEAAVGSLRIKFLGIEDKLTKLEASHVDFSNILIKFQSVNHHEESLQAIHVLQVAIDEIQKQFSEDILAVRSQYSLISKQFTDRFSELSKRHEELNIFINQGPKHEAIFNDLSVKFNLQLASYVSKADLQQALSRNLSESSLLFQSLSTRVSERDQQITNLESYFSSLQDEVNTKLAAYSVQSKNDQDVLISKLNLFNQKQDSQIALIFARLEESQGCIEIIRQSIESFDSFLEKLQHTMEKVESLESKHLSLSAQFQNFQVISKALEQKLEVFIVQTREHNFLLEVRPELEELEKKIVEIHHSLANKISGLTININDIMTSSRFNLEFVQKGDIEAMRVLIEQMHKELIIRYDASSQELLKIRKQITDETDRKFGLYTKDTNTLREHLESYITHVESKADLSELALFRSEVETVKKNLAIVSRNNEWKDYIDIHIGAIKDEVNQNHKVLIGLHEKSMAQLSNVENSFSQVSIRINSVENKQTSWSFDSVSAGFEQKLTAKFDAKVLAVSQALEAQAKLIAEIREINDNEFDNLRRSFDHSWQQFNNFSLSLEQLSKQFDESHRPLSKNLAATSAKLQASETEVEKLSTLLTQNTALTAHIQGSIHVLQLAFEDLSKSQKSQIDIATADLVKSHALVEAELNKKIAQIRVLLDEIKEVKDRTQVKVQSLEIGMADIIDGVNKQMVEVNAKIDSVRNQTNVQLNKLSSELKITSDKFVSFSVSVSDQSQINACLKKISDLQAKIQLIEKDTKFGDLHVELNERFGSFALSISKFEASLKELKAYQAQVIQVQDLRIDQFSKDLIAINGRFDSINLTEVNEVLAHYKIQLSTYDSRVVQLESITQSLVEATKNLNITQTQFKALTEEQHRALKIRVDQLFEDLSAFQQHIIGDMEFLEANLATALQKDTIALITTDELVPIKERLSILERGNVRHSHSHCGVPGCAIHEALPESRHSSVSSSAYKWQNEHNRLLDDMKRRRMFYLRKSPMDARIEEIKLLYKVDEEQAIKIFNQEVVNPGVRSSVTSQSNSFVTQVVSPPKKRDLSEQARRPSFFHSFYEAMEHKLPEAFAVAADVAATEGQTSQVVNAGQVVTKFRSSLPEKSFENLAFKKTAITSKYDQVYGNTLNEDANIDADDLDVERDSTGLNYIEENIHRMSAVSPNKYPPQHLVGARTTKVTTFVDGKKKDSNRLSSIEEHLYQDGLSHGNSSGEIQYHESSAFEVQANEDGPSKPISKITKKVHKTSKQSSLKQSFHEEQGAI